MQVKIYRYDPDHDEKPRMQEYKVEKSDHKMLLDLLIYIKDYMDPSLSFRRSCRQGVCGSDGMNVNGKNMLACITPLSSLQGKLEIRPLSGMPVVRDLVVDMDNFFNNYKDATPWLQADSQAMPSKEFLQSQSDRAKLDGLYECILCGCCSSACPSYWWNPDKFLGPAAALQAARFIHDSRDGATVKRLSSLGDAYKIFRCRSIYNCADVCPKGLNPGKAISTIRHKLIDGEC